MFEMSLQNNVSNKWAFNANATGNAQNGFLSQYHLLLEGSISEDIIVTDGEGVGGSRGSTPYLRNGRTDFPDQVSFTRGPVVENIKKNFNNTSLGWP